MEGKRLAIVLAVFAAVFYAIHLPIAKYFIEDVDPLWMASLLYFGAGVGVLDIIAPIFIEEIEQYVLERDRDQLEELITLLKSENMTLKKTKREYTFADKISDNIAWFAGSWTFIILFLVVLVGWILFNLVSEKKIDPFRFILLNLVLSCVAAIQAPLVLMSQKREEERNKEEANADFYVNVKSELLLEDIHDSLKQIQDNQKIIMKQLEKQKEKS